MILILTSVITFCLESVPYFEDKSSTQYEVLYVTDIICVAWFTFEFVIRFIFCPRKLQFIKKPMNWIDFGAILPFYVNLLIKSSNIKTIVVLRVVRLIRVFRIFKLSRHSYGLQILGHTLRSSCSELFLLAFFLSIGVVIFSSIIYYAEKDIANTKFTTIPASFWWAVVTMTTLGYGDMAPESWEGKIVGSFCAISGVLMIALPVPVIVSNFSLYYSHAKARLKLPKRKRPLIIGAANALKVAQSFVTQSSPNISTGMAEKEDQNDSDMDDTRPTSRTLRSPHTSFRSTPRGSPMPGPRFQNPNTMITPPSPRNSLLTSGYVPRRGSLLAVPEAERIEIEMEERNPCCSVLVNEDNSSELATKENASQQSSPSGINFTFRTLDQTSEVSSVTTTLSPKRSETESASPPNGIKTPPNGRQRSTSSTQSLSIDSTQESPKPNSRGRMGRRGSLYVVGFTAKHWQNLALKKNKKTQSAQTDAGSRRASATSADRRSSAIQGTVTSSSRRNSSKDADTSAPCFPEKVSSQLHLQLTALKESETTTETRGTQATTPYRNVSEKGGSGMCNGVVESNEKNTQTSRKFRSRSDDNARFKASAKNKLRDEYRNGKSSLVSLSIESNDSSARMSDDSLTINDRHRQRRGSSPLVRQKAVFTFDIPDQPVQVDPSASGNVPGTAKRKPSPARAQDENGFSLSPLIEHSEHELTEQKKYMDARRNSCIPAITMERKSSSKRCKTEALLPNGFVNGSYHYDDEDRVMGEKQLSSISHHPTKALYQDAEFSRTRSETFPLYFAVAGDTYPSVPSSKHAQPFYTEAKSLGQYAVPPNRQVPAHSDSNLPSISEEHVVSNHKQRGIDVTRLGAPAVLPRPNSLPNWSGNLVRPVVMHRPHSDSVYMHHSEAYPFPSGMANSMGSLRHSQGIQQFPSPPITQGNHRGLPVRRNTYSSFEEQRAIHDAADLAQRRQGHVLYVHVPPVDPISGSVAAMNLVSDRDRIPEVSRNDKTRSKGNSCEHIASPFFQKTESLSSPDLHSMNGSLALERLSSNLSNSWHQSPDQSARKRQAIDLKENGVNPSYHSYPSYPNIQTLQTPEFSSIHSVPNSFQDVSAAYSSEQIKVESILAQSSSDGRSPGRPDGRVAEREKSASSPRLERSDGEVIYNGHEVLQQRESLGRPASVPMFNRQRARAMFVGDSGIESVGSLNSMTHSVESEVEGGKERKESVTYPSNARIDILNPIHESETELSDSAPVDNARNTAKSSPNSPNDDLNKKKQLVIGTIKVNGSRMTDILRNPDLYESSLV